MSAARQAARTRRSTAPGSAGHKRDHADAARRRRHARRRARARALGRARRHRPPGPGRTAPCSRASASAPTGIADGEVCFNTAMTGYQEILTDPSYAGQIVTFTFPHIGNVGTNDEDLESLDAAAGLRACAAPCIASAVTEPVELARVAPPRRLAEGPRHRRHHRDRHPRAHRADPRQRHAERGHRPRSGGPLRPRGPEGPRRGPRRRWRASTSCRR